MNRKSIVDSDTLKGLTDMLVEREAVHKAVDDSSDDTISEDDEDEPTERTKRRRFSDTLIQQRMEEDRERVWIQAVPGCLIHSR